MSSAEEILARVEAFEGYDLTEGAVSVLLHHLFNEHRQCCTMPHGTGSLIFAPAV